MNNEKFADLIVKAFVESGNLCKLHESVNRAWEKLFENELSVGSVVYVEDVAYRVDGYLWNVCEPMKTLVHCTSLINPIIQNEFLVSELINEKEMF